MSRNTKNTSQVQKLCKVCQDAGKTEAEYRSHFTREGRQPNSIVICPTLLALECRYCFKKGHTVKYCNVLKKENNIEDSRVSYRVIEKSKNADNNNNMSKGKITNVFACLEYDSEEDTSLELSNKRVSPGFKPNVITEEYPALVSASYRREQSVSFNYAAALSNPAATIKQVVHKPVTESTIVTEKSVAKAPVTATVFKAAPWASGVSKTSATKTWAYCSDSDSDSTEEFPNTLSYNKNQVQNDTGYDSDW
jgi:hypothetical protein